MDGSTGADFGNNLAWARTMKRIGQPMWHNVFNRPEKLRRPLQ
jgi:hypothetical protein